MSRTALLLFATLLAATVPASHAETASTADKPAATPTAVTPAPDKATAASEGKVETRDAKQFFDDSFNDMPDELKTAKADGKKGLLIMFEMDECPFCHRMKNTVLNRSDVQDYFKENFRIITIDIEGDVELKNFKGENTTQKDFSLKEFRVRATPVFQFIDLEGKPIKNGRLTGATKDAAEFMQFGEYITSKKNEEMPFTKYKREADANANKTTDAKS